VFLMVYAGHVTVQPVICQPNARSDRLMVKSRHMLIHSASQLLTLAGGPQRGSELGRLEIIPGGAVLVRDEKIAAVGPTDELRAAYPDELMLDASRKVVMPGFVDPHTHAI